MRYVLFGVLLIFSGCLKESDLKQKDHSNVPLSRPDGWSIASASSQGVNEAMLKTAYDQFFSGSDLPHASALLVVRHGKLVSEAYAQTPEDADKLHNVMSCTKSVVSMLVGIARKQNLLDDLNAPVSTFFPELVPDDQAKRRITLRNCLTMQAGLEFNGGASTRDLAETNDNSIQYIFTKHVVADTGSVFLYSDYPPQLINGVLRKVAGQSVQDYASANLFQPLGIDHFMWESSKDGLNYGAFSLYLRPRDLAKLGQLCLQQGTWNGTELFPATWMDEATRKQAKIEQYGYFFWLDPSRNAYLMKGNGGQFVFVAPDKDLVIVYTAFPYSGPELWGNTDQLISTIYNACN